MKIGTVLVKAVGWSEYARFTRRLFWRQIGWAFVHAMMMWGMLRIEADFLAGISAAVGIYCCAFAAHVARDFHATKRKMMRAKAEAEAAIRQAAE